MAKTRSKRGRAASVPSSEAVSSKATSGRDKQDKPPQKRAKSTKTKTNVTKPDGDGPFYHLFKSEPESRMQNGREMKFSLDDLAAEKDGTAHWDGVRNFEARNCMQRMKKGDLGFFYHSNTKKSRPGIVGIVKVVKEAYPGL